MAAQKNQGKDEKPNSQFIQPMLDKKEETSAVWFVVIAIAMWIFDYILLGDFKGYVLQFPEAISSYQFMVSLLLAISIAALAGWKRDKNYKIALFAFSFTISYLFLIGAILFATVHFLFIFTIIALIYKESEDFGKDMLIFSIIMLFDFFGYAYIGNLNKLVFNAPSDIFLTFQNRLIFPIWFYYVLMRKKSKLTSITLIFLVIINILIFMNGFNTIHAELVEAPGQRAEQLGFAKQSLEKIADSWYGSIGYALPCLSNIGQPADYQICIQLQQFLRLCKKEKQEGETTEQCVRRKQEEQKTTGAIDRTITDYVDVTIEQSTTKKEFTMDEDIEITYKLKVQSPKVPIKFSNVECKFINQETKQEFDGFARTTFPLNQETQIIAGNVFITCVFVPEDKKPGKYENIVSVEINDIDTYATLSLYFMGTERLYSQIGYGEYQELLAAERSLWPNNVNNVLVDGKVQSRAYPGLIWPIIGEPLENNKITTLPVKGLQEGEKIKLVMSLVNKGTGKVTKIKDLILELPEYTAVIPEGMCSRLQPYGENKYSLAQTTEGKIFLENKVKILADQKQETTEDLLSCDIDVIDYFSFIDNPNAPSDPKYFTVYIKGYSYEIQKNHFITIKKTELKLTT